MLADGRNHVFCFVVRRFKPAVAHRSLTSHDDGGGLLGRVAHVVAGHAAVDAGLAGRDGGQGERAALHHAPQRQTVVAADPGEEGRRLSAGGDAHQGHGLARVHHDGVLHQELDGRGSWRGGRGGEAA